MGRIFRNELQSDVAAMECGEGLVDLVEERADTLLVRSCSLSGEVVAPCERTMYEHEGRER